MQEQNKVAHHGRDHLMTAIGVIAEFISGKYGISFLAWIGAVFLFLSFLSYTKSYLSGWGPIYRYGSYALSVAILVLAAIWVTGGFQHAKVAPPSGSEGLKFHEDKVLEYAVHFGGNIIHISAEELNQQVPFSRFIQLNGSIPLSIYISDAGDVRVSAILYDKDAGVAARIMDNNFIVLNHKWDRNWDGEAFEIVDENKIPLFQVERPENTSIVIRGIFRTSGGELIAATDNILAGEPKTISIIPTIFQYPSSRMLHVRK